jgi:allene oxide cyclase
VGLAAHDRAAQLFHRAAVPELDDCLKLLSPLRLLSVFAISTIGLMTASSIAFAEPQEIKLVEHATTDAVIDTGASSDSAGDILTFSNEVYDADDNKVGSDQGICFRTVPGKALECFWTLNLEKGQLTVAGPFYDSADSVLAITGGTGEFAGSLGEMALSARGIKGDAYNFVYRIK